MTAPIPTAEDGDEEEFSLLVSFLSLLLTRTLPAVLALSRLSEPTRPHPPTFKARPEHSRLLFTLLWTRVFCSVPENGETARGSGLV